jgi:hypothetical protein
MKLLCTLFALAAVFCSSLPALAQHDLTQADLLNRIVDLDRLTTPPPVGEVTGMFSSYDRRSRISPQGEYLEWDANQDRGQYLRRTEDGWDVMAEVEGPGALVRFWSANPHGDLRMVLDGETVIDTTFDQLMSGRLKPFVDPFVFRGLNCYFPIGFSKRCLVLCRKSSSYYHINYVKYPEGTRVQRFSMELDDAAQAAAAEVAMILSAGYTDKQLYHGRRTMPVAVWDELGPGEKLTESLDSGGTLRALYLALTDKVNPRELYSLHRCILRIWFDGESEPAVEVPLVDFFGSGFDLTRVNGLAIGTNKLMELPLPDRRAGQDTFLYCYYPMPYRDGVRIEIENLNESRQKIGLLLYMRVETKPPADDALRFNARFRMEDPCEVLDYRILQYAGRGRLVGCTLNVDCPRPQWWGEGDEKIWIDAERFPSTFGTGTEDYFGDAWGLHKFGHALVGVSRANPYGKNAMYRWHIPDVVNFQKTIYFTIENWQHGRQWDTYYSSIAYWYGTPGGEAYFNRLTEDDLELQGLRIPNSSEIEDNLLTADWGNEVKQKYAGGVELSGEAAANVTTTEPVKVGLIAERAETVRLQVRVHPRRPFEPFVWRTTGGRVIGTVTYDRDRRTDGIYDVGVVRLEKGLNTLVVQCGGPTQLDCLITAAVPHNQRGPEAEELAIKATRAARTEVEFGRLAWLGGAQLLTTFDGVGGQVTFDLPQIEKAGPYVLRLHYTAGPTGATVQPQLDGRRLGEAVNTWQRVAAIQQHAVGPVELAAGAHTLRFDAVGVDAQASGMTFGLDAVEITPVKSRYACEGEDLEVLAAEGHAYSIQPIGGASGG